MSDMTAQTTAEDQSSKEAYFTASQRQLIWARFKKQRAAMIAAMVLVFLMLSGLFAPFLSPYDPTIAGRDKDYTNGAPQMPQFCDSNGCSLRPFIHGVTRERSMATNFRWVTTVDEDIRLPMQFFVRGDKYKLFGFIPGNVHLFGVEGGKIHLFGTDEDGQDIFSRTLHAVWTSMQVGTIGVVIAFVLALIIGGVAGYYGGWIDSVIQMITDAVRTVPVIPLFMAISAIIAAEGSRIGIGDWTLVDLGPGLSSEGRFFIISVILGLVGWPTLARRVRTHLLTERNQEYVLAAQLCGANRRPRDPPPSVAQLHQLYHRRSGHQLPLHGAVRNRAVLHRPRPERPGQLARRDAAKGDIGRCSAELSVVFHPGDFLRRPCHGFRLCRRRAA